MQIGHSLSERISHDAVILTMGKFDGLHLGHHHLISSAIRRAHELGVPSVVLTWEPHPSAVIRPDRETQLLSSLEEKIELFGELNPDYLLVVPFTPETMRTSAADYLAQIAAACPLHELWVGDNFAMGRGRAGDIHALQQIGRERGFRVNPVAPVIVDGARVSSSRVRECLLAGDIPSATTLLGRAFRLRGVVVQGDQRGRTIGFPTANLATDRNHVLPSNGVYAGWAHVGDTMIPAVTNIGVRPTFDGTRRTVEAHLLDWSGDLYGEVVRLDFSARLRGEQRFANIQALIAQISADAEQARQLLRATPSA